jgi:hypothetical protein
MGMVLHNSRDPEEVVYRQCWRALQKETMLPS